MGFRYGVETRHDTPIIITVERDYSPDASAALEMRWKWKAIAEIAERTVVAGGVGNWHDTEIDRGWAMTKRAANRRARRAAKRWRNINLSKQSYVYAEADR